MSSRQPDSFRKKRSAPDIAAAAKKLLGFPSLRPGQEDAVRALLEGRDTLVVQPTGSGKSAIYQIAGALLPGATVIVSPLIALQKDQAESIAGSNLEEAAIVNSTLSSGERRETLDRIEEGQVEYIFLAPEQICKPETRERLQSAGIALFVVDEAHCVSQWGHNFRPDYLDLANAIEILGHPPVLALTATASPEVRRDIVQRLDLRRPRILVSGFDRPNISLRVDTFTTAEEKREAVLRRVEFADKPGIVYVSTHKAARTLAEELQAQGVAAVFYHGGLRPDERETIQNRFMSGAVPVIVATNAFGMGIDKPDIRFVYHADVGESLDAYYQEIGRAGRDGAPAEAVLFYRARDIGAQRFRTGGGIADPALITQIAEVLVSSGAPVTLKDLAQFTALTTRRLANLLHVMEDIGAVRALPSRKFQWIATAAPSVAADAAAARQLAQKEQRQERLRQMKSWAESKSCRRATLLRYFGDEYIGPCRNCDRCEEAGVALGRVA